MNSPGTVEIRVRKDSINVRYREYYVDQQISIAPHKLYTLPIGAETKEKLYADIGPVGASLITMLNKIEGLDFIYLTHNFVGLSKKRGIDWTKIEKVVFLDIQAALDGTSYRTKNYY